MKKSQRLGDHCTFNTTLKKTILSFLPQWLSEYFPGGKSRKLDFDGKHSPVLKRNVQSGKVSWMIFISIINFPGDPSYFI